MSMHRDDPGSKVKDTPELVLTLVEKLHRTGILNREEYSAAGQLRNLHLLLQSPPEDVSSYGQSTERVDLALKADSQTNHFTGIGELIGRGPSQRRYRDALFAMAVVVDDEGRKVEDPDIAAFMLRAINESEPTQTKIGRACAAYVKEDRPSGQVPAQGAFFVKMYLRRLAKHFRTIKVEAGR